MMAIATRSCRECEPVPAYSVDVISFVMGTLFGVILVFAFAMFANRR